MHTQFHFSSLFHKFRHIGRFGRAMAMDHDGVISRRVNLRGQAVCSETAAAMLSIPCPDPTAEECARDVYQSHGQSFARQEDWEQLAARMQRADLTREATAGGMPVAELLSYGARADVVRAAEHVLLSKTPRTTAPIDQGTAAFDEILDDFPKDPMIAAVVAQTHIDIAWAWRGNGLDVEIPQRNRAAFREHFSRAREILRPYNPAQTISPLIASIHCAASADIVNNIDSCMASYERLILLAPLNARAFRAMGLRLLPQCGGTFDALELQARRMAARTYDTWGSGGYTWTMLDAIVNDGQACARLDIDFFVDGLYDILHRFSDQHIVNTLAAYCANIMETQVDGSNEADLVRAEIAKCADWIVREWLTELHPVIWAHAARGFDQGLRIRSIERFAAAGTADAHRILANLFRPEISQGKRITFTPKGVQAHS